MSTTNKPLQMERRPKKIKTVAIYCPISETISEGYSFFDRFIQLSLGDPTALEVDSPSSPGTPAEPNDEDDSCINLVLEDNEKYLTSLDPSDWKEHDHYKVLGLQSKRINATMGEIRVAYRQLVLKHHPDKRKVALEDKQDDYFPALTKSFEILSNPKKRIAYDSVDPFFDDTIPKSKNITAENFLSTFAPVFERNARWSVKKPVPLLGDDNTSYDDLMNFYKFWINFESWREFSYLDEEEKEKGADREERRYLDKLNKAERLRRKNAENTRIRQLVDCAMCNDPRIKRKREEESKRKQEEKDRKRRIAMERENELQAQSEAQKREEEARKKEEAEKAEQAKKERDLLKKESKAQKKLLRDVCKQFEYFCVHEEDPEIKAWWMEGVDMICLNLSIDELKSLNAKIKAKSKNEKHVKEIISGEITKQNEIVDEKRKNDIQDQQKLQNGTQNTQTSTSSAKDDWTTEEIQCLVKALQLLPPGTDKRWIAISNFINNHVHNGEEVKTHKQVVQKAKNLQNLNNPENSEVKSQIKQRAADNLITNPKSGDTNGFSSSASATNGVTPSRIEVHSEPTERTQDTVLWTANEQKLLEAALKNYSPDTENRWERIAEAVPGKSKKECMKRYKEIVELLKAKKAAQKPKVAAK